VPATLKPVIILLFIFLFQQLSGGYVVIFYAVHVFQMVGGTFGAGFDEYDTLVFLGLIRSVVFYAYNTLYLSDYRYSNPIQSLYLYVFLILLSLKVKFISKTLLRYGIS
jgi:hypothetical protein